MALSNYTELQAAIRTRLADISTAGISDDAIQDAIAVTEAKINSKIRLREAEQLATATYQTTDNDIESRRIAVPVDYVEILSLLWKNEVNDDITYEECKYVPPERIHQYYTDRYTGELVYTLRKQIEFARPTGGTSYELIMHFVKKWDIATDTTNWLLTHYPHAYLYGSCLEAALHLRDQEAIAPASWKALFDETMDDLDDLSMRGRDDAELDTSELAYMGRRNTFNILNG